MKNIIESLKALFLFKPYTGMPRLMEIGYGLLAWFIITMIIYELC